jgi:hypothetical protein
MYLKHKNIARMYAFGHDWWLYILATAAGEVRLLPDAPRTLWRQHASNVSAPFFARNQSIVSQMVSKWRMQDILRQGVSRQAQGFILASVALPPGPKLDQVLSLAPLVAKIDRRQSPAALARLLLRRAMWPGWRHRFWMTAACLWSDSRPMMAARSAPVEESSVSAAEAAAEA